VILQEFVDVVMAAIDGLAQSTPKGCQYVVQVLTDACGSDHVEIVRRAVIALTRVAYGGDTAVIDGLP
jgi:hypothetical protein